MPHGFQSCYHLHRALREKKRPPFQGDIAFAKFINSSLRAKSAEAFLLIGSIVTSEETFAAVFENYVAVNPHPATVPGSRKVVWTNRPCSTDCTR